MTQRSRLEPAWRSQMPGHVWPAIIDGIPAEVLALAWQLDESQWWTADQLRRAQFHQLHTVLTHAARHVPFYRRRLREAGFDPALPLTEAVWARVPRLTRQEAMDHGPRLHAAVVPPERGAFDPTHSGGSTGVPVRVTRDGAQLRLHHANTVRAHDWHCDTLSAPIARFCATPPGLTGEAAWLMEEGEGLQLPDYGAPMAGLAQTGTLNLMHQGRSAADKVAFLQRVAPGIVNCKPSHLRLLLSWMRDAGVAVNGVQAVWVSSEVVDPALRALCRDVLGCPIVADYSSSESGYLAVQCPDHDHYHVCAESVLVEVLDDAGRPCEPGSMGQVVVTPLHAIAMPMLRYELGDMAEVGHSCPCGRGLPVLAAIAGRTRDTLLLEDGSRRFIGVGFELAAFRPVREYQLVQTRPAAVEIRLVATRTLTPEEEGQARALMLGRIGRDVTLSFSYHPSLPRTAAGKLRQFVSDLA